VIRGKGREEQTEGKLGEGKGQKGRR